MVIKLSRLNWMPVPRWRRALVWVGLLLSLYLLGFSGYRFWLCGPGEVSYPVPLHTPDYNLPAMREPVAGVDVVTTTESDFPEFLGVGRRSAVDHITLNPDWTNHPPKEIWRQPIGAGWSSFSVVNGFAVTMEQRGKFEQVTCYALKNGEHHWTVSWEERYIVMGVGPRSTPTISGGRVYALGAWGHLVCIDGNSGKVIWERELLHELGMHWNADYRNIRYGRSSSPLVVDGMVIVPGGGVKGNRHSLLAFDAVTGKPLWRGGKEQISFSSPVVAEILGEKQILIVNESTVAGHDSETGTELWSLRWPGHSQTDASVSQPLVLSSNKVFLSKGYRRGCAVIELSKETNGGAIQVREVWARRKFLMTKFTNVAIWKNHAYGLSEGVLECVNIKTGERRWKDGRYGHGQILRVKDMLLVLSEEGELVLVRLDPDVPNDVKGRLQVLQGRTWNNITLYGRHLLVRNASEAVSYELAVFAPPDAEESLIPWSE